MLTPRPAHAGQRLTLSAQKPIVVGRAGHRIRELGIAARQSVAEALGKPVHLNLFVKVVEEWSSAERELQKLGYSGGNDR